MRTALLAALASIGLASGSASAHDPRYAPSTSFGFVYSNGGVTVGYGYRGYYPPRPVYAPPYGYYRPYPPVYVAPPSYYRPYPAPYCR